MSFRVGIVGAGGIGRYHVRYLRKIDGVRITAVQDVAAEAARQLAAELDAAAYTDHVEMYDAQELDAVFVGIPPFAHTDQETAAARRGIHLFVQKPTALDMAKAREVEAAVADAGVVNAVGYQMRYADVVPVMQSFLADRKVGLSMGYYIGGIPGAPWWRQKAKSGGQAVEQTTHVFDLARCLLGEVTEVYASAATGIVDTGKWPGYDLEDATAVNVKYASGASGVIFSGCFKRPGIPSKTGFDIFCPDARVELDRWREVTLATPGERRIIQGRNDPSEDCIQAFVDACRSGDPGGVRSTYADAAKTLEITLAANRSLETGRPVQLPLTEEALQFEF